MPTSDTTSTPATALDASAKKDTRSDSLISLELQAPSSNHLDDPEAVDRRQQVASYQVPTWKAVFLIFRSLVGIGVLTMPHAVQSFGVNGALILLPIFTVGILYVLDLVLKIANDLGFNGSNIDELIVKSGNEKWRNTFSIINNWMMIAGGVANCIFAVMFLNWAACSLGWGICGNKIMTHLIAFVISIPLAFVPRMNFFVVCTFVATVIIAFTVNYILGYQTAQLMSTGINSSVNWFRPLRLGEFFGVACFSIEGIGLIFPIRSTMSNYQSFRPVFHITASIVVFWYFIFGATGALYLGSKAKGVILFIYGRTVPGLYYLSELYALGIFLSFPMLLFPIAASALSSPAGQRIFGIDAAESYTSAVVFRAILITFCYICSITGINIIDFVNLTGAGFNCVTAFVFPIIFYINYFEKKGELSDGHKKFLILLLITCSALSVWSLIDGVYSIFTGRNG